MNNTHHTTDSEAKPKRQRNRNHPQGNHCKKWASDQFLADYYEVSRCTIWRWVKIKKLPSPQKIGDNCTRWDFEKIQEAEKAA